MRRSDPSRCRQVGLVMSRDAGVSYYSPSGRPPVPKRLQKSSLDMDSVEDQQLLLKALAKNQALTSPSRSRPTRFQPILKHPLPVSDHSAAHDANYRRATCCALHCQAAAAVTFGDAWVLEELYMQGAPMGIQDKNGFAPIHLAVQLNSFVCVMVLINAGANVNVTNLSGVTPLYLAVASGASECASLLRENGGVMELDQSGELAPIQALDVSGHVSKTTILDNLDARAGSFKRHTLY